MFFEGAPRLIKAGVTIPGLQTGDPDRIVVEAYPGVLARKFIPGGKYKNDSRSKQTADQRAARCDLFRQITNGRLSDYGKRKKRPIRQISWLLAATARR